MKDENIDKDKNKVELNGNNYKVDINVLENQKDFTRYEYFKQLDTKINQMSYTKKTYQFTQNNVISKETYRTYDFTQRKVMSYELQNMTDEIPKIFPTALLTGSKMSITGNLQVSAGYLRDLSVLFMRI